MASIDESLGNFNSAINFATAQIGAVKDKKWIEKENQKARDFSLQMYHLNNMYNHPARQVQRLRDAGLNAALAYGDGIRTLADQASTPGFSAPNMNSKDMYNQRGIAQMQLAQQRAVVDSTVALNESQAEKNRAEAENLRSDTEGKDIENTYREDRLQKELKRLGIEIDSDELAYILDSTTFNYQVARIITEVENLATNKELTEKEVQVKVQELLNKAQELTNLQEQQKVLQATRKQVEAQAHYYDELAKNQPYERQRLAYEVKKLISDINRNNKLNQLSDEEMYKLSSETEKLIKDGNVDRAIKLLYQKFGTSNVGILFNSLENLKVRNLPEAVQDGTMQYQGVDPYKSRRTPPSVHLRSRNRFRTK